MDYKRLAFVERSPVLLAAFAFMAGIAVARVHWRPAGWLLLYLGAASAIALLAAIRGSRSARAAALAGVFALGAFCAQLESYQRGLQPTLQRYTDDLLYTVTGHVTHSGMLHLENSESRQVIDIETEQIDRYGDVQAIHSGIRLTIYGPAGAAAVPYGARLRFDAQLREPLNFRNPGAWDYRGWLAAQGITALATAQAEKIERLAGFDGSRVGLWRYRARMTVLRHIHGLTQSSAPWRWLRFDENDVALLEAMTLGEKSELERDTKLDFQRTGSFHLLVVSGMNIAIFTVAVFWVAQRLPLGDVGASLLTALFALGYAATTDLGAPIVRALIMALVFLCARLLYRRGASLNAIGSAALVVLALQPSALFEASFQMTFLSVLAILVIIAPLLKLTVQKYARGLRQLDSRKVDFAFPPEIVQFRIDVRLSVKRLARITDRPRASRTLVILPLRFAFGCAQVLVLSALMQCVMALPTAIYFHRITWAGLATNTVVVPLMEVLMPIACVALVASYGPVWMAKLPVAAAAVALHAIVRTVSFLGGLHVSEARVPDPAGWVVLFATSAFIAAWIFAEARRLRWMTAGALVLVFSAALLLLPRRFARHPQRLEVTAIDVGQGDSLLVVTPEGRKLLIDAGGPTGGDDDSAFDFGENVVSPYLWNRGITRLDAVAITHGHSDHMQGIPSIIANFRPRELWIGALPASELYDRVIAAAHGAGTRIIEYREGEHIQFGSTPIDVLAPARAQQAVFGAKNDDSLSLYFHYGDAGALLSGDAEHAAEARIALHHPLAQFLKVDHHGSATSTDPGLLAAVRPRFALISVGRHNHFGHPKWQVLKRLEDAHVRTFRTDSEGAVTFLLDQYGAMTVKGP